MAMYLPRLAVAVPARSIHFKVKIRPKKCYCTAPTTTSVTSDTKNKADPPRNTLDQLKSRSLLKLDGPDSSLLLQGLITNDIYHLPQGGGKLGSLYAMFLNSKGRILCDSLIYCMGDANSYIIEADALIIETLMKHLKMYKLKKQVDIQLLDSYKVFVLYDPRDARCKGDKSAVPLVLECVKEPLSSATNGIVLKDMHLFCDPRVPALGYRILTRKLETVHDELCVDKVSPPSDEMNYRWHRYNLGVGEGIVDMPPQVGFPLEHNCDYMNGLSLHKGCYLGQELTARTYHTGKVRKRLMPLFLNEKLEHTPENLSLHDDRQQSLGKLRGVQFNAALALLRMHLVVDTEINVGGTKAGTRIPHWWPGFKTAKQQENAETKCV